MQFLVGRVLECSKHPDAEKLFVESVDCGEPDGPRTICSGLAPYMAESDLVGKNVVVLANLKPRKMAGIASAGMLLCANDGGVVGEGRRVELLMAPEEATPGERLAWEGSENAPPHGANKVAKKKIWEKVQPELRTNDACEATFGGGARLVSVAGAVTCASLKGGGIS
jgi:aminoacyl tRNA synthase complex-interacting multifunctional protein 1